MTKKLLTVLRLGFIAVLSVCVIVAVLLMIFENSLIFFPDKYPAGYYADAARIPSLIDCRIPTEDGLTLHGWFLPAENAPATLLLEHGNAGNISNRIMLMMALHRHGFNVLMFDYRGYGKSQGTPSEEGIYLDGRAAFDFTAKLPQVDPHRIIVWGTSLGGAAAVDLATRREAAGLILESTFTSAADMAAVHYPFFPARFLLRVKLDSKEKIARVHTPLLVMHGNRDRIVPFRFGKELFGAANGPKEFYEIDGANHNDTYFVGGQAYFQRVRDFVLRAISRRV